MDMVKEVKVWKESSKFWFMAALILGLLVIGYFDAIDEMMYKWETKEEYGYGYIIPFITGFLIWQKKDVLEKLEFSRSNLGIFILLFSFFLLFIGKVSTIFVIQQYGFVLSLIGIVLMYVGLKAFKIIMVPMILLFFMIPLPVFIFQGLSGQLQLISSELGVAIIRLFDISVFLEGNVIDLGVYKLQVVEACSGLNYLFPLMTLAFISANFFTGAFWKKAIIFLSSIPITIFMNSFRIGAIGVTVEYWGPEMAEGILHDFEGWAVFMSCIFILVGEMWLLARLGSRKLPLREAFGVDFPEPTPEDATIVKRDIPNSITVALAGIILLTVIVFMMPKSTEIEPARSTYATFPLVIDGMQGRTSYLEQIYIDALKFTDYAMIDYQGDGFGINFYSAYYSSQKSGASAHSPRSCIPGGGWKITSLTQKIVNGAVIDDVPLKVNRLVIQKEETKQLVYYWFQQRGRIVTNEYLMKWYLFLDSMNLHRTDGALMRLTTVLQPGQDISIADKRLEDFSRKIAPLIPQYVPGK